MVGNLSLTEHIFTFPFLAVLYVLRPIYCRPLLQRLSLFRQRQLLGYHVAQNLIANLTPPPLAAQPKRNAGADLLLDHLFSYYAILLW